MGNTEQNKTETKQVHSTVDNCVPFLVIIYYKLLS